MKLRDPAHEVDVFERNRADDTFGWGVVFSDQTVENLMGNDPVSGATIRDELAHWDDIDVHIDGECIRSSGHGFIGIGRKRLLAILQQRARELGVALHFEHEASTDLADWADYDLVIAADGANSRIRNAMPNISTSTSSQAQQILLARHGTSVRCLHLRLRTDRGWLDLGARLSLRRQPFDVHRRMRARDLGGSASTG
jgi:2-polyprenyl-6-methoxyphenol hydroxylase-like FAD-dependent oxidoreductase